MNQRDYEYYKQEVQGYYHKFNTEVLKWHMHKMFNYEELLESAKDFESFSDFYNCYFKGREDSILRSIDLMFNEAKNKKLNCSKEFIKKCIIVRLGNIYTGMYTENKIIETFNNLSEYVTCLKSEKIIDINYKVDAVVELAGLDKLAIQIKPVTFLNYDKGEELKYHERYATEFQAKVYYVFYKGKNTIFFNGKMIDLSEKDKILQEIENILG